jgi:hypothetical protein
MPNTALEPIADSRCGLSGSVESATCQFGGGSHFESLHSRKAHMKPQIQINYLIAASFFALCLVSCSREPATRYSDKLYGDTILHAEADALQAKIVLIELREGHRTNALELLESQIDTSVIMLDQSLTNLSGTERDSALGTLRLLKAYREAYPRQQEAAIQGADKKNIVGLSSSQTIVAKHQISLSICQ